MNIYLLGVIGSIVLYMAIGWWAGSRVKNVNDYYVSGRNAPTLLIAGTLFASMISTNGFMGDTGFCYTGNITSMVLLNALCGSGYVFGVMFFGRYLRRSNVYTMPEYYGKRFDSIKIQQFSGIITVISLTAYLLACIQGTGILMQELTGMSRLACLIISWACFASFTFYSGSSGVIITDTMMFMIFLVATIIGGPYLFQAQGGIGTLLTNLMNNPGAPAGLLDFHGNIPGTGASSIGGAVMYAVTVGIIWMVTVAISPWQAGRNMMAKSEHVAFRSGTIAAICTTVFLTYLYLMAVSVININPALEDPQRVIIWSCYQVMPKIIGVFVLTGVMAAGLSSASTFLSVIGFSVTNDIFNLKFKDEAHQLKISRYTMLAVSVVALILAYLNFGGIRIISWFASTIIACAWAVPAFGSVWSKKLTSRGALWAMYGGFFGFIGPKVLKEFFAVSFWGIDPFFIGLVISLLCAYFGSKGQTKTAQEWQRQKQMHILPKEEKIKAEYKRDKIYGWVLVGFGVFVSAFLLLFWALPYNGFI